MHIYDDEIKTYRLPLTMERHLENLATLDENVKDLESIWHLMKKQLQEQLVYSRSLFANYSVHDASHSRAIISSVERVLGENRIAALSPTDTFMILICAYAHDYGMAMSYSRIYNTLNSNEFLEYLDKQESQKGKLSKEESTAIHILWSLKKHISNSFSLQEIYRSINEVLQMYLRPTHWKGVEEIDSVFRGIFEGNIKIRFINGSEGIIQMCQCHGMEIEDIMKLSFCADGMVSDTYHPRFVAAMLRLGDLLDLDNGRFPLWFVKEVSKHTSLIPELSIQHYYKHESITHLLITPEVIEVFAQCGSEQFNPHPEDDSIRDIAHILNDWTSMLERECQNLVVHWNSIAPVGFGRAPGKLVKKIMVGNQEYNAEEAHMQMKMSQERVMALLKGTNIYKSKYVGIREMIQNAVDASLLQMWNDILENRYLSYGLSKDAVENGFDFINLAENNRWEIFGNYEIVVEVVKDYGKNEVLVIVKDRGIGIKPDEIKYIANLGSSKENNERVKRILKGMPAWLCPSGVFGIGLQSVFQLTNCIEFYSRQPNEPEHSIRITSTGQNRGRIDYMSIYKDEAGVYADNAVPGTNVKIKIDPEKLKASHNCDEGYIYYDTSFDSDSKGIDIIFAEISNACTDIINESEYDFFKIQKIETIISDETRKRKLERRKSFFYPRSKNTKNDRAPFGETFETIYNGKRDYPYSFDSQRALYWNREKKRIYWISLRPCIIKNEYQTNHVYLPEPVQDLFKISYKFNTISNIESLYDSRRLHAGFVFMNVQILDDNPQDYLNIDRDRLRDGAISEDELCEIRKLIITKWCRWFNQSDNVKKVDKATLISLVLVFEQNVPHDDFTRFIEKYRNDLPDNSYKIGNSSISIDSLWNFELQFTTGEPTDTLLHMSEKTVYHLPHKLVVINEIQKDSDNNSLNYCFSLRKIEKPTIGIIMSQEARFDDYCRVLGFNPNESTIQTRKPKRNRPRYNNLIKKLFKPDSEFPNIITNHYPHTFTKGNNFQGNLDYIVERYILSPFDESVCSEFAKLIGNPLNSKDDSIEQCTIKATQSSQFKKCVRYICTQQLSDEVKESQIAEEYKKFVQLVFATLWNNRNMLGYVEKGEKKSEL